MTAAVRAASALALSLSVTACPALLSDDSRIASDAGDSGGSRQSEAGLDADATIPNGDAGPSPAPDSGPHVYLCCVTANHPSSAPFVCPTDGGPGFLCELDGGTTDPCEPFPGDSCPVGGACYADGWGTVEVCP